MGPARRPPGRNRLCRQGTTWDLDPPCVLVDTQGEGGGGVFLWYTSSRLGPTSCRGPRRFSDRSTPVGEPVQAAPLGGSLACGLIPLAGGKGGGGGGSRGRPPKQPLRTLDRCPSTCFCFQRQHLRPSESPGGDRGGAKSDPQNNLWEPWTGALALVSASSNNISGLRNYRRWGGVGERAKSDPPNDHCEPWTGALALAFASSDDISGLRNCSGGCGTPRPHCPPGSPGGGDGGGKGGGPRAAPKRTSVAPGPEPLPLLMPPASTSQAFGIARGGGGGGVEGRAKSDPQNNLCGPGTGARALAFASSYNISGLRNCSGGWVTPPPPPRLSGVPLSIPPGLSLPGKPGTSCMPFPRGRMSCPSRAGVRHQRCSMYSGGVLVHH